jgi:Cu-processing system ATP-binding protein
MICINDLNKSFKGNHALKNISLHFDKPGIAAILGPNGSGKTTLLKCLLGMVLPENGEILFKGKSIKNEHTYRAEISYLSQIARFPENHTATELIRLMKKLKPGDTRGDKLIEMFNLRSELGKKMGSLSGGTRQKVNITLALMHDTPVIILDEPSTGLDPLSLKRFKNFILEERGRGKLILITTHILDLAESLADDVLFLLEGNIYFDGSLNALLANESKHSLEDAIAHILESSKAICRVEII